MGILWDGAIYIVSFLRVCSVYTDTNYDQADPPLGTSGARKVLGTRNLGDILSERESIPQDMLVTSYLDPQILIIWTRFSPSCLESLSNCSRDPREPWTKNGTHLDP